MSLDPIALPTVVSAEWAKESKILEDKLKIIIKIWIEANSFSPMDPAFWIKKDFATTRKIVLIVFRLCF